MFSHIEMNRSAYQVKTVADLAELDLVYNFAVSIFGKMDHTAHTLAFYRKHAQLTPSLLVYAVRIGKVIGCVLGSIEEDHVLVGPTAVAPEERGLGVGLAMMQHIEEEAKKLNQTTLILGALQNAESFYIRCGYRPNLFIQFAEMGQLERLKQLNPQYQVVWEAEEGKWTRLMLATPQVDRNLQAAYDKQFPGCFTQYVFIKEIA
jgi:predicted N-acetyltransferase YhbS